MQKPCIKTSIRVFADSLVWLVRCAPKGDFQRGVPGAGQDCGVAENLLHFKQINPVLNSISRVAVVQTARGDLF